MTAPAGALLDHALGDPLGGEHQAAQVGVDDAVEDARVQVEEAGDRVDAGVVDQDVDRSELLDAAGGQPAAGRRVGDVGLDGPHLPPLITELLGRDLGRALVDVADEHIGARLGHTGGDAEADPHRTPGHDRALAFQVKRSPPGHVPSPRGRQSTEASRSI